MEQRDVIPSEGLVEDLAGAILDGTPIDWASAESGGGAVDRALFERLKVLATLADLHRQDPAEPLEAQPIVDEGHPCFALPGDTRKPSDPRFEALLRKYRLDD